MEILTNKQNHDTIQDNASSVANSFQVTNIKQAIKNENRANIFINGEYAFSLDITQLVDAKLKIGTILSPERLKELRRASDFGKLYQRTLEWVLARPRSVKETRDYIARTSREKNQKVPFGGIRSYDEDSATRPVTTGPRSVPERNLFDFSAILSRLIDKGYLDDRKFAEHYIENRFVKKGISKKRLRLELVKKGVSQTIIEEVLAENTRNDTEEIQKIIAKKRNKYDDTKLIAYLIRQGFDYDLAKEAIHQDFSVQQKSHRGTDLQN